MSGFPAHHVCLCADLFYVFDTTYQADIGSGSGLFVALSARVERDKTTSAAGVFVRVICENT